MMPNLKTFADLVDQKLTFSDCFIEFRFVAEDTNEENFFLNEFMPLIQAELSDYLQRPTIVSLLDHNIELNGYLVKAHIGSREVQNLIISLIELLERPMKVSCYPTDTHQVSFWSKWNLNNTGLYAANDSLGFPIRFEW